MTYILRVKVPQYSGAKQHRLGPEKKKGNTQSRSLGLVTFVGFVLGSLRWAGFIRAVSGRIGSNLTEDLHHVASDRLLSLLQIPKFQPISKYIWRLNLQTNVCWCLLKVYFSPVPWPAHLILTHKVEGQTHEFVAGLKPNISSQFLT